jgi:flagellar operon protein
MGSSKIYQSLQPLAPISAGNKAAVAPGPVVKTPAPNFQDIFRQELGEVKFSQHALARLEQRDIRLDAGQVGRLKAAVDKAAQKGARDSLVLMDKLAFVVSVRNRTVITAMADGQLKDNLFTNIDSAIVT